MSGCSRTSRPTSAGRSWRTMRRHSYAAGEVVFHEGDAADTVHFVIEGRVVARRSSEHGDRLAYAVMGPGQAFGELAMIVRGGRRTATIETVEPTVTLALRFADFERLCARHPEVSRLLVRLLAARVNRLTEALMEALHTPAELRVVRSLVSLCGVYSTGAQGHSLVAVRTEPDRDRRARRGDPTDRQPGPASSRGRQGGRTRPWTRHRPRPRGTAPRRRPRVAARPGHAAFRRRAPAPVHRWVSGAGTVTGARRSAVR